MCIILDQRSPAGGSWSGEGSQWPAGMLALTYRVPTLEEWLHITVEISSFSTKGTAPTSCCGDAHQAWGRSCPFAGALAVRAAVIPTAWLWFHTAC